MSRSIADDFAIMAVFMANAATASLADAAATDADAAAAGYDLSNLPHKTHAALKRDTCCVSGCLVACSGRLLLFIHFHF